MHRIVTFTFSVALISMPFLLSAQGLVPCGKTAGDMCGLDDLMTLGNNLITFLITLATLIAVILLAIGGFKLLLSRGNPGAMEEAKSRIWNVFIGFLIILLAWLVVQTILSLLTGRGFEFWNLT